VLDNAATAGQIRPLLPGDAASMVVATGVAACRDCRRVRAPPHGGLLDKRAAVELIEEVTNGHRKGEDPRSLEEIAGLRARLPLALRNALWPGAMGRHLRSAVPPSAVPLFLWRSASWPTARESPKMPALGTHRAGRR